MAGSSIGLDIGGANLKACHSSGACCLQPFAVWKNPDGLALALKQIVGNLPAAGVLAVTMTGELCDCFQTRREGVQAILAAVESAAAGLLVVVWQGHGQFVDLAAARRAPLEVAAANWLALGTFAGRLVPKGAALLIDIGSTTTDIIPLLDGRPVPLGRSDPERLHSRELVYTGVRRTPVCALLGGDGAAEWFATTLDVYLVLQELPEDRQSHDTADGRPATVEAAHGRLAHMLCGDRENCSREETYQLAQEVRARQIRLVRTAIDQVADRLPGPPRTYVLAGSGEFLARQALDAPPALASRRLSLAEQFGAGTSQSACAYALAVLALERLPLAIRPVCRP
jgi:probable H4MPT-linked C1 transfer pathway protein